MSTLTARLNAAKQNSKPEVMYSVNGAKFQEYALSVLDAKGSEAHRSIGHFVTAINNDKITIVEAIAQYSALLSKD